MDNQNLVDDLRKVVDWLEAECFPQKAADLVREAINVIEQLSDSRSCMTVSVTLSNEQMKKAMEQAFVDVIGKDLEYIAEAVYEKMEREGEIVGKAQETETDNSEQSE